MSINDLRYDDLLSEVFLYYRNQGLRNIPVYVNQNNLIRHNCYLICHNDFGGNNPNRQVYQYYLSLCLNPSLQDSNGNAWSFSKACDSAILQKTFFNINVIDAAEKGIVLSEAIVIAHVVEDGSEYNWGAIVAPPVSQEFAYNFVLNLATKGMLLKKLEG